MISYNLTELQFERSSLLGLSALVSKLGGDPDRISHSCQYDLNRLTEVEHIISYDTYDKLLEAAALTTNCNHFGLLLGQQADLTILGTLGELTRNCRTFGEAIETFIRYYNIVSLGDIFRLDRGPVTSSLIREPTIICQAMNVQVQDVTLSEAFAITRLMRGKIWKPAAIHLSHKPKDLSIYETTFGCPIHSGQPLQAMSFQTCELDLPMHKADALLHKALEVQVAKLTQQRIKPFKHRVLDSIKFGLATGECDIKHVAKSLSMHSRTLHRKLHQNNTTFTELLEETRRNLASHLLTQTNLSVIDISQSLAYSDPTAFSRSCRRWFGTSPIKWRKLH